MSVVCLANVRPWSNVLSFATTVRHSVSVWAGVDSPTDGFNCERGGTSCKFGCTGLDNGVDLPPPAAPPAGVFGCPEELLDEPEEDNTALAPPVPTAGALDEAEAAVPLGAVFVGALDGWLAEAAPGAELGASDLLTRLAMLAASVVVLGLSAAGADDFAGRATGLSAGPFVIVEASITRLAADSATEFSGESATVAA